MIFLAGISGLLKILKDRFTSTRAANLDNLDATVSSRAVASTALSNAVWTDGHAAIIDDLITDSAPVLAPIIGIVPSAPGDAVNDTSNSMASISGLQNSSTTATTYTDLVNYSGQGVIEFVGLSIYDTEASIKVIVDGVTVGETTVNPTASNYGIAAIIGGIINWDTSMTGFAFSQVPFFSSLVIQAKVTSSGTANAYYRYRKTA